MCECVFCHKEQNATDFVYEDELVMSFMDMGPINEGHEVVEKFTGKIITIVHRNDDVEEKWIVAPEGMTGWMQWERLESQGYLHMEVVKEEEYMIRI